MQLDPQALQVYRDIAELRLRLGEPEAALVAAEKVKELAPKDPALNLFGQRLGRSRQFGESRGSL